MGAVHVLSRKFPGYKKSTRGVLFQVISIHAAVQLRIDSSRVHPPLCVCPGYPTQPTRLGSHCRVEEDADGEIRKRVNTSLGDSQSGFSLARSYSVLQRKERQARSGSGVYLVHKIKRCLACGEARSRRDLPQTRPCPQGTHSLPRPRPLPRPAPRVDPPRRPPGRRDAPEMPRAAPC